MKKATVLMIALSNKCFSKRSARLPSSLRKDERGTKGGGKSGEQHGRSGASIPGLFGSHLAGFLHLRATGPPNLTGGEIIAEGLRDTEEGGIAVLHLAEIKEERQCRAGLRIR